LSMADPNGKSDRRRFLREGARAAGAVVLVGAAGFVGFQRGRKDEYVWQLDPDECMACGNCATHCVLDVSAVKAVQCYPMCGMCDLCTGYFDLGYVNLDTAAENQLCPVAAIERELVGEESGVGRFEYHIDESKCIGCGKCVKGCAMMNGSLYLQVRHDRCLNCNQCSIAVACPTQAFRRVPASDPYLLKSKARAILGGKADEA
jgi:electron transport complex protein RnfB